MCSHLQHACIVSRMRHIQKRNRIFFPLDNGAFVTRIAFTIFFYYCYLFKKFFFIIKNGFLVAVPAKKKKHSQLKTSAEIDERNLTVFSVLSRFHWWWIWSSRPSSSSWTCIMPVRITHIGVTNRFRKMHSVFLHPSHDRLVCGRQNRVSHTIVFFFYGCACATAINRIQL